MLERDIQKQCLQLLHAAGIYCWRQNAGAVAGEYKGKRRWIKFASVNGVSDILGIMPRGTDRGRLLAIEIKRPGKKLTPDQEIFQQTIIANGGVALKITSAADLESWLRNENLI